MGYQLGVDLGTTYTAAAVLRDGRAEIATLGTRTLQVPSVTFLLDDGTMLVGEPAERRSFTRSDRFAREFKRRIGDPTPILLGGTPFSAHALSARLLRAIVTVVADREGGWPDHTVVTCPASWSEYKRDLLDQAIRQADIGPSSIATEPEAAAVHYASTTRVRPGEVVAVYDLGGGTFDASVLRAAPDGGFELLGVPQGLEHLGGVQFDDAVFAYATRQVEQELAELDPEDPATLTALARLRRECVEAKEALSSDTEATILVTLPNWQTEIRLTRSEFEAMIRPALADTIETLRRTLRSADLQPEDVTAVLLVGGSSRIPLISELVADELGRPTAVDIHPKHAVAMGAAYLAGVVVGALPSPVVAPPPPLPPGMPIPPPPVGPAPPGPPPPAGMPFPGPLPPPITPTPEPPPVPPLPPEPVEAPPPPVEAEPPPFEPVDSPPEPPPPFVETDALPPGRGPEAEEELATAEPATEAPPEDWWPEPRPSEAMADETYEEARAGDEVGQAGDEVGAAVETDFDEARDVPGRRQPPVLPGTEERPRSRRPVVVAVGAVGVVVLLGGLLLLRGGGDGGGGSGRTSTGASRPCAAAEPVEGGGELVADSVLDTGPAPIDPARPVSSSSVQLVNVLYDGLTEVDARDPENPRVVPQVAESYRSSADATVWTFSLREGLRFSNGEPVLPSSFVRGWERATSPAMVEGNDDVSVFGLIEGGFDKLDGSAPTLAGVQADDEARTLQVRLHAPHADFDAVVAFQPFMPLPEAAERVDDPNELVGNGPFMLASPPGAEGITLARNPEWNGTCYDSALELPEQPAVESLRFRAPPGDGGEVGFPAVQSGEAQVALIAPNSVQDVQDAGGNVVGHPLFGADLMVVNWEDPVLGGADNVLLRQAISQAIDRDTLNEEKHDGAATVATGVAPPAVPGAAGELCDYCTYDPEAARAAFDQWEQEGNSLPEPILIPSPADPGTGTVLITRVVEDLNAVGIQAQEDSVGIEAFLEALRNGDCGLCLFSGTASYLSYDGYLYDLFHTESIGRFNAGHFSDETFDDQVDQARGTVDDDERAELYRSAEERLLNEAVAAVPLLWTPPSYVYGGNVEGFAVNGVGLIVWERLSLSG